MGFSDDTYDLKDKIHTSIKNGNGIYNSIFTNEFVVLEDKDKDMIIGMTISELFGDTKTFIDEILKESK